LIKKISSKNPVLSTKIHSIDYVHLRPEHIVPINIMLRQNFWNGIDISECLEYTDYTIVALYGKLIIGFAFMVPNEEQNQAYLSFIWVHPDWRNLRNKQKNHDVSIGQYMLYYLIQKCHNYEIQLHVSVNSSVVSFYQKFGFKIEEYIKNFYDKYYSSETKLSKDAFLMRLSKN
jgi:ribosomal protein S18 acetylase RimI-like enzyme